MTETQKKYKSDAQVKFEERLLMDAGYFAWFAKAFMDPPAGIKAPGLYDGYLEWSWRHKGEIERIIEAEAYRDRIRLAVLYAEERGEDFREWTEKRLADEKTPAHHNAWAEEGKNVDAKNDRQAGRD